MASQANAANAANNMTSLRDVLATYNKVTELCFSKCVSNLNYPHVTEKEAICVESCGMKNIITNHRVMAEFLQIQTKRQQKMIEEAEAQQQAVVAQAAAAEMAVPTADAIPSPTSDVIQPSEIQDATPAADSSPRMESVPSPGVAPDVAYSPEDSSSQPSANWNLPSNNENSKLSSANT